MQAFNLIRLQEAMQLLGVSRATIDRWRKERQLPVVKLGKEVWVDRSQLEQWVRVRGGLPRPDGSGLAGSEPLHAADRASGPARSKLPPAAAASTLSSAYEGAARTERSITVGYQSGAALLWSALIVKRRGWFEEELALLEPHARWRVRWRHADSGMELVEELIAGRVQIASVGDYPIAASRELGRLLPRFRPQMLAFDGKSEGGSGISLVVRAGSGIRREEQLGSSFISTVGRSSASRRLQEVLRRGRLDGMPVLHHGRMADCLGGLLEGRNEAAMLWEPYLTWVRRIGAGVPLEGESGGSDYLTGIMADAGWAEAHESAAVAYLKAHLRAHALMRLDPGAAAMLIGEESGFPLEVVASVLGSIRWDASVSSRDLATLDRLEPAARPAGASAADAGEAFRSAAREAASPPAFRPAYLQEAVRALRLPSLPDIPLPHEWAEDGIY
ncbi:helix-turn-helix domain-containing protein [Paenibacillus albicereus]|uniref:Helix-turn-helix domain-containing protein n=1 Tax=Paenibacillus albicereus TaxID=2726185 RepID=A0A6H2GTT1_9BACL|nr:helix-turn-helix domain-containing protein [Paenibacillus albicereus]QJC50807.1 helix-turn-helix domain-containing protein [Paenibacillus albicereus]